MSVGLFVIQSHDARTELIHSTDLLMQVTQSERLLAESMKKSAVNHSRTSSSSSCLQMESHQQLPEQILTGKQL